MTEEAALIAGKAEAARSDAQLDITGETCPMTFVRTRIALDRLSPGQTLEVTLKGSEPRRSVPAMATSLGHAVTVQTDDGERMTLKIMRDGGRRPAV
jgi:tRNA 2-thiouridine synthesizing protein A